MTRRSPPRAPPRRNVRDSRTRNGRDEGARPGAEGGGARRGADKADGERDVLAKIAEMPEPDRVMAERIHAIVKASAPGLSPKTWYGMPAYAKDGKVVCFFQSADKFKSRYATFGFEEDGEPRRRHDVADLVRADGADRRRRGQDRRAREEGRELRTALATEPAWAGRPRTGLAFHDQVDVKPATGSRRTGSSPSAFSPFPSPPAAGCRTRSRARLRTWSVRCS